MTRINIGIRPSELCDAHLMAEIRELPRVRAQMIKRIAKHGHTMFPLGVVPQFPTLGKGHVTFFLPYGEWLKERYLALQAEAEYRGFKTGAEWREVPAQCQEANMPPLFIEQGRAVLIARINERLLTMTSAKIRWTKSSVPLWVNGTAAFIASRKAVTK
jgi:hypothetical protein